MIFFQIKISSMVSPHRFIEIWYVRILGGYRLPSKRIINLIKEDRLDMANIL